MCFCLHGQSCNNIYSLICFAVFSWNWFEMENCSLISAALHLPHKTNFKLEDEMWVWWKRNNFDTNHPTCLSASLWQILVVVSFSCPSTFPSFFTHYVSVSFFLCRFHKESLLDPDDSAACDSRDHLCFSLLVRHLYTREFLPKKRWNHVRHLSIYPHLVSLCRRTQHHTGAQTLLVIPT